jgi:hypothetical protein
MNYDFVSWKFGKKNQLLTGYLIKIYSQPNPCAELYRGEKIGALGLGRSRLVAFPIMTMPSTVPPNIFLSSSTPTK